jgi:regulator of sirC expression with transglutaminase-like and TPR domain
MVNIAFFALAVSAAAATPAVAPKPAQPTAAPYEYNACLKLADRRPEQALEMASEALKDEGDPGAEHCAALALVTLKQYGEAARRLDVLARKPSAGDAEVRAQILGQAGNAWLLAGQPEMAQASLTAALALMPGEAEYHVDRARAAALLKKWSEAETDLTTALAAEPGNVQALVLRASARRAQKNIKGAMGDITQALLLEPENVEALVERGLLRAAQGDKAGARQDFIAVLTKSPQSEAAASARMEIEKLEVKSTAKAKPKPK